MLVFFIIVLIFAFIITSILTMVFELEVKKFEHEKEEKSDIPIFYFNLYTFFKIRLLKIPANTEKLKKIEKNRLLKEMDVKTLKEYMPSKMEWTKLFHKIELKKFNLKLQLGLERADITAFLVVGITSILSLLLSKFIEEYKEKNYYYKIDPIYHKGNYYKIKLDCIIRLKMVHIIYIIYVILKKRRGRKNARTSNRRPYEYSYE